MAAAASFPPGFRFRPTDEEMVGYYLKKKRQGKNADVMFIREINMYKYEPWDLPEKSFLSSKDPEWYFFCPRDRKYPNGSRTNRATEAGYWKATGKDRKVSSRLSTIGMKKTLVFYKGRAPHGERTDWLMHEYRLEETQFKGATDLQDDYVLCRVFKKSGPEQNNGEQYCAPIEESSLSVSQNNLPPINITFFGNTDVQSEEISSSLMQEEDTPGNSGLLSETSSDVLNNTDEENICRNGLKESLLDEANHTCKFQSVNNNHSLATPGLPSETIYTVLDNKSKDTCFIGSMETVLDEANRNCDIIHDCPGNKNVDMMLGSSIFQLDGVFGPWELDPFSQILDSISLGENNFLLGEKMDASVDEAKFLEEILHVEEVSEQNNLEQSSPMDNFDDKIYDFPTSMEEALEKHEPHVVQLPDSMPASEVQIQIRSRTPNCQSHQQPLPIQGTATRRIRLQMYKREESADRKLQFTPTRNLHSASHDSNKGDSEVITPLKESALGASPRKTRTLVKGSPLQPSSALLAYRDFSMGSSCSQNAGGSLSLLDSNQSQTGLISTSTVDSLDVNRPWTVHSDLVMEGPPAQSPTKAILASEVTTGFGLIKTAAVNGHSATTAETCMCQKESIEHAGLKMVLSGLKQRLKSRRKDMVPGREEETGVVSENFCECCSKLRVSGSASFGQASATLIGFSHLRSRSSKGFNNISVLSCLFGASVLILCFFLIRFIWDFARSLSPVIF